MCYGKGNLHRWTYIKCTKVSLYIYPSSPSQVSQFEVIWGRMVFLIRELLWSGNLWLGDRRSLARRLMRREAEERGANKALWKAFPEKSCLSTPAAPYYQGSWFSLGFLNIKDRMMKTLLKSNDLGHTNSGTILLMGKVAEFTLFIVFMGLLSGWKVNAMWKDIIGATHWNFTENFLWKYTSEILVKSLVIKAI